MTLYKPTSENILPESSADFLKVEPGQKARIIFMDEGVALAPRHWVETAESRNPYACTGNIETVFHGKPDADNCTVCGYSRRKKSSEENSPVTFPEVSGAVNVMLYPGGGKNGMPADDGTLTPTIWVLNNKQFNVICKLGDEHGELQHRDMILERENKAAFPRLTITMGGKDVHKENESYAEQVEAVEAKTPEELLEAICQSQPEDIEDLCQAALSEEEEKPAAKGAGGKATKKRW